MKALILEDINNIAVGDIDVPILRKGEALVKVMAAGICGSDVPRSYRDGAHVMPIVLGHEFSGEVVAVETSDMTQNSMYAIKEGARVGVFPLIPCGKCNPCINKHYEMCRNYNYLGSRCNGGFAEYVAVPIGNLIELPDSVSFEQAAMLEPMAVAVHSMKQTNIVGNENIVVCGLGTIGILLVMFLKELGVENIIVIGNKDFQKKTMLEMGIREDRYCDIRTDNVADFISDKTKGNGADIFFECVGKNETINIAVDNIAPAGQICLVGNPQSDVTFDKKIYWKILRNQINIHGTWNSSFTGEDSDDWHYVIKRLSNGSIKPEKLITQRFTLEDVVKGFELMRDKSEDYVKVMAYPQGI